MSEEEQGPTEATPEQPVAEATGSTMSAEEIEGGKAFAILSYAVGLIGLPFFLVPLIMRNNDFSLYHAKQCLVLWLASIVLSMVGGILTAVCIGVFILLAALVFFLVFEIMGIINAVNGRVQPLPLIGKWGEDWFKGITKA